ncbi:MAG: diguanylate cyclase [Caldimonas sp.]
MSLLTQGGEPALVPTCGPLPNRPKLLIVDDQAINVQALYQVFAASHQVFVATSGEQALTIARDKLPDLILLDIEMPDLDGYTVCERLKANDATRNIPVIFVTARNDSATETKGLEVGAVDFIAKPFNPTVVRARVKTHMTLKAQSDLLRQMVFIDGLTGVYNRRFFDERIAAESRRCARNNAPLALILVDVDHFKRYNDRYGHQAGDECLRRIAATLQSNLKRPADFVARYGGEEFACILPETEFSGAMALAELLEKKVRALCIDHAVSDVAEFVSASFGIAEYPIASQGSVEALISTADAQLYRAKAEGRGRACGVSLGQAPAS